MKKCFGFFCKYTIVEFAQTQKVNVFWKFQSLAYLELFLFYQSGNFWRFCGDFRKKNDFKKNFFFQNFFFKFLEIAFFELNLARFEEKFFLKISHFGKSVISDTILDF